MVVHDFILETSTGTGGGDIALDGAVVGHLTFATRYAPGDPVYYGIVAVDADGVPTGQWELGLGTLAVGGGAIVRTTPQASSNSDAAVNFSPGTKRVYGAMSVAAVQALIAAAISDHISAADPHGDRAYADGIVAGLDAAAVGADPAGTAASAVAAHVATSDPHGDRAYAAGLVGERLAIDEWDGVEAGEVGLPGWHFIGSRAGSAGVADGQSYLVPITPRRDLTVSEVIIDVATVGTVVDISIWEAAPQAASPGFTPTARVANVTGVDISTTSMKVVPLTAALTAGRMYVVVITPQVACMLNGWVANGAGLRTWRRASTQAQVVMGFVSVTGYPAPSAWASNVVVAKANGASGFRAQCTLTWSVTP